MSSIWVAAVAVPNRKLPRPPAPDSGPNEPNAIGGTSLLPPQPSIEPSTKATSGAGFTPCIVPEIPYTAQLRNGQGNALSGAAPGPADASSVRSAGRARRRVAQGAADARRAGCARSGSTGWPRHGRRRALRRRRARVRRRVVSRRAHGRVQPLRRPGDAAHRRDLAGDVPAAPRAPRRRGRRARRSPTKGRGGGGGGRAGAV